MRWWFYVVDFLLVQSTVFLICLFLFHAIKNPFSWACWAKRARSHRTGRTTEEVEEWTDPEEAAKEAGSELGGLEENGFPVKGEENHYRVTTVYK